MNHEHRRQVKIDEATITLRNDGIVQVTFHKRVLLDLPLQMLLLNIYQEVTARKPHPFLFTAMAGVRVSREARDNALRIEEESPGNAYAVVAPTLTYQLIANFFLKVRRPTRPYRVFRMEEEAVKWLLQFVGKD